MAFFVKRKTVALFCRVIWCYFCRCESHVTTVEEAVCYWCSSEDGVVNSVEQKVILL